MSQTPGRTALINEAIHILREGIAEARNPVLLFSARRDSTYLACPRQVVERSGALIVADDPLRMRWRSDDQPREVSVRFRTLGCWSVTAAISSNADRIERVVAETASSVMSERQGRVSDEGSLEAQKRQGYF